MRPDRMIGRLQKLREQRDVILKHLQWIETEIASEVPNSAEGRSIKHEPPSTPLPSVQTSAPPPDAPNPNPIDLSVLAADSLESTSPRSLQSQVRKGCLVYFGLAWVALAAVVGLIYFAYA